MSRLIKPTHKKSYEDLLCENATLRRRLSEGFHFSNEQLANHDAEIAQNARREQLKDMEEWKRRTTKDVANALMDRAMQSVQVSIDDEERESIMSQSIVYLLGISVKVLRESFGFGAKRLQKFGENVIDDYNNGEYELDELRERIYADTGIKFYTADEAEREGIDGY